MKVYDSRKFLVVAILIVASTLAVYGSASDAAVVVKDVVLNPSGQSLEADITTTGPAKFTFFELEQPHRLVVDFRGLQSRIAFREKKVDVAGVERVRTALFESGDRQATRIVFDLKNDVQYQVRDLGAGVVKVLFGSVPPVAIPEATPAPASNRAPSNMTAGPALAPPSEVSTPGLPRVTPESIVLRPQFLLPASEATVPAVTLQAALAPAAQAAVAAPAAAPRPQYTGELVSFDLKEVDFKDFFRLIGDLSGLNIVLDPNISGNLTILLKDIPWDQALDIVLKNYNFGKQLDGNVLRIASNTTLQNEENQRKALQDAQELAADMVTRTYLLNYTKSDTVSATVLRLLTKRGTIIQDPRRNALIVTDIPPQFDKIEKLVKFLDTPAQQVEIEARLLSANKSFSRDLGTQLGVLIGANSGNMLTGASGGTSPNSPASPLARTTNPSVGLPLVTNFAAAATSGLAFLMQPGSDVLLDSIITAAEARGTARLLSTPRIMAQNNQAAVVSQGTQIPVQTNVNNTISVQFLEFALKLTVTPQITEAGTILLTLTIDNSQPDFARAVNGVPSVSTQRATTQVLIPDGGTAGIAGILIDTDSLNIRQVPGLGSLPVIGRLFKETSTIKSTSELLFFITARIKAQDSLNVGPAVQGAPGN